MLALRLRTDAACALLAIGGLVSCSSTEPLSARPRAADDNLISAFGEAALAVAGGLDNDDVGDLDLELENVLFEITATPRSGAEDDVWGLGFYAYPEAGWGAGLQIQGTLTNTDPEVEVVLTPPAAELQGRDTEYTIDLVATYRVTPGLGLFGGVGLATIEEFRRFEDAIGNDFFVRQDEDLRGNLTVGAHLWLTGWLTASAQWDSVFEAATFGLGVNF
jgi:hypothetical protein